MGSRRIVVTRTAVRLKHHYSGLLWLNPSEKKGLSSKMFSKDHHFQCIMRVPFDALSPLSVCV